MYCLQFVWYDGILTVYVCVCVGESENIQKGFLFCCVGCTINCGCLTCEPGGQSVLTVEVMCAELMLVCKLL